MGMNNRYPSRPEWHPIMSLVEYEPGRWLFQDTFDRPQALVDFVRRGDELGYRVTSWTQNAEDRELVGYFRNLRAAAAAANQHYIRTRTPRNVDVFAGHRGTIPPRPN